VKSNTFKIIIQICEIFISPSNDLPYERYYESFKNTINITYHITYGCVYVCYDTTKFLLTDKKFLLLKPFIEG